MALLRNTFVVAAMLVGTSAFADSISPEVYEATLAKGESVTIKKTVTVSAGRPSSSKVDVFFLSDTTGSMGGIINSVRTNASTILADTAGLGDVNWGVGSYKDTGDVYTYREEQALTDDTTDVQAGINTWGASGGGDFPEGNQIALREVANNAGWRAGSKRILIMFGDAPGHQGRADGAPTPYPASSEAETEAALAANNVTLITVGPSGLLSASGGATANWADTAAEATGGDYYSIGSNPGSTIADVVKDAIDTAFSTYKTVALEAVGNMPGVDVEITPAGGYVGDYERDVDRDFMFDVKFTAKEEGTHEFVINALVDGSIAATEKDKITVPGGPAPVPLPASLPMLLGAFAIAGYAARRRKA
ncbi:MAG: PEP-CTERM sorting domain-containing protein [Pseudomonadota bacterium]